MITPAKVRADLPRRIRKTRAMLIGELIAEGRSPEKARSVSADLHRQIYQTWLVNFAADHPNLETVARSVLRQEGVL